MYERFYGFRERPFSLLPDPDFLFLSKNHRTALDLLELAVFNHSGFCVISGEIGAGKTTLIRELLKRLDERIRVGLVSNTHPSFGELLQWVMAAYGLPCAGHDKLELHRRFIDFTIEQYAANRHTLLIVDEAQNLTPAALEELRMLSNVNSDKDLVLQIMLVGQQQLRAKLKDRQLEQFAQRIALDYHLDSLGAEDTRDYIRHRLQHAGGKPGLFSDSAIQAVHAHTCGIPRLINRLCDLCLVYGYSDQCPSIDAGLVARVAEDQKMGALCRDQAIQAWAERPVSASADNKACQTHAPMTAKASDNPPQASARGDSVRISSPVTAPEQKLATQRLRKPAPVEKVADADCAEPLPISDTEPPAYLGRSNKAASAGRATARGHGNSLDEGTDNAIDAVERHALAGRTEPMTAPEPEARAGSLPADSAPDDLHKLVVAAERRRVSGKRGALWLLLGVVVLAGATGWEARELWLPPFRAAFQKVVFEAGSVVQQAWAKAAEPAVEVPEAVPALPSAPVAVSPAPPVDSVRVERKPPSLPEEIAKPVSTDAVRIAALRQKQALQRETERLQQLRQEVERLERERLTAEQTLARQKTQRQALERAARREQQRVRAAMKIAERVELERVRAEKRLSELMQRSAAVALPPQTKQTAKPPTAVAPDSATRVGRTQRLAAPALPPRAEPLEPGVIDGRDRLADVRQAAADGSDNAEVVAEPEPVKFSSNPCNGPSARFMSTCR